MMVWQADVTALAGSTVVQMAPSTNVPVRISLSCQESRGLGRLTGEVDVLGPRKYYHPDDGNDYHSFHELARNCEKRVSP